MEILSFGGGLPLSMHKATWTAFSGFSGGGIGRHGQHLLIPFSEAIFVWHELATRETAVPEGCPPDPGWAWKAGVAVPYLRLHVCVVVVLQEQSGCFCVVFAGRDVEGWETHLSLRVVLEQE